MLWSIHFFSYKSISMDIANWNLCHGEKYLNFEQCVSESSLHQLSRDKIFYIKRKLSLIQLLSRYYCRMHGSSCLIQLYPIPRVRRGAVSEEKESLELNLVLGACGEQICKTPINLLRKRSESKCIENGDCWKKEQQRRMQKWKSSESEPE